jgi:hypothetical protein
MSLLQRVTSIDGVDREPEPSYPERRKSIRRMISYDVFPQESAPTDEKPPEIAPYNVSTAKKIGECCLISRINVSHLCASAYPAKSPGSYYGVELLARVGNCVWLRITEARPHCRRSLRRQMQE